MYSLLFFQIAGLGGLGAGVASPLEEEAWKRKT